MKGDRKAAEQAITKWFTDRNRAVPHNLVKELAAVAQQAIQANGSHA
jgi:hypothetical protein